MQKELQYKIYYGQKNQLMRLYFHTIVIRWKINKILSEKYKNRGQLPL